MTAQVCHLYQSPNQAHHEARINLTFAPILLQCFAIWMRVEPLRASEKPYFPGFASFCHMNLRIRKPMLYPLSYGSVAQRCPILVHSTCPAKTPQYYSV